MNTTEFLYLDDKINKVVDFEDSIGKVDNHDLKINCVLDESRVNMLIEDNLGKLYNYSQGKVVIYKDEIYCLVLKDLYKWYKKSWCKISTTYGNYGNYSTSMIVYDDKIHFFSCSSYGAATMYYTWDGNTWTYLGSFSYSTYASSLVVYNNEIHILGGYHPSTTSYTKRHYKLDGTSYSIVSTLPYSFYSGAALVYNDEIHILGGGGNTTYHYKWDGESWSTCRSIPYIYGASVPTLASAVVYNNEIHIFGSNYNTTYYKYHYKYNSNNTWTADKQTYANSGYPMGAAIVYKNDLYISIKNENKVNSSIYKYDDDNVSWEYITLKINKNVFYNDTILFDNKIVKAFSNTPYGFNRYYPAIVYNNKINIFSYDSEDTGYQHITYDGETWEKGVSLTGISPGCVVEYNAYLYLLGGSTQSQAFKRYDGYAWTEVSTLPYSFDDGSAVVYNNEIHILGGTTTANNHYKWNGMYWESVSTLPYRFASGYVVVYNNEIHILGGRFDSSYQYHYKWNGNSWESVSTLPISNVTPTPIIYNNHLYIYYTNNSLQSCYKFVNNQWVQEANFSLTDAFSTNPIMLVYNDVIHLIGRNTSSVNVHYKIYNKEFTIPELINVQKGLKINIKRR